MKHFFLLLCLSVVFSTPSFAATITVTTTTDELTINSKCSLREAIININNGTNSYTDCTPTGSYGTDDTIELNANTYCLNLKGTGDDSELFGDLDIKKALTISGKGQSTTIIDAGNRSSGTSSCTTKTSISRVKDRVFQIHSGITGSVALKNLTITGGLVQNPDEIITSTSTTIDDYYYYGAGIYTQSNLSLDSVIVSYNKFDLLLDGDGNNHESRGGGIYADNASTLTITNSTISSNKADSGGICVNNNSSLILTDSTISSNEASNRGGGIYADNNSSLTVTNSTISKNLGSGIYANENSSLTIANSTISKNLGSVGSGISADENSSLTITNCTISENSSTGISADDNSSLTLNNSTISENSDDSGIYVSSSTLTLTDCLVSANNSSWGGGIYADENSSLTLTNSTISGNSADGFAGGGIYIDNSTLSITDSTIFGNSAGSFGGGGIYADENSSLTVSNSTISSNNADYLGGGIYADATSAVTVTNSTISSNDTDSGGGGGIYTRQQVKSSTLYRATINLKNTILAGNTTSSGKVVSECEEAPPAGSKSHKDDNGGQGFVSYGYNFIGQDSDCVFSSKENPGTDITDQPFTDLKLDSLADNGGSVQTQALLAGSPALDVASCTDINGNPITTDQRGYLRPTANCDIGAYEYNAIIVTDNDGDGYYAEIDDCDDNDSLTNPSATETCNDMSDINCDGVINSEDSTACPSETTNDDSSATSSDDSSATSSDDSSATSSDDSSATSNDDSSATSNDDSSATSNDDSSATSNDDSSATSNDDSSATSNDDSSATSNDDSSATANDDNTPNPTESSSGGCSLTTSPQQGSAPALLIMMLAIGTLVITRQRVA